jgi:hypothetical protein
VTGYSCFLAACAPITVACGAIPVTLPGLRQGEANSNIGSEARSPASPSLRHGYKKKPTPPFPPPPPAPTPPRHPNPRGAQSPCSMQCNFGFRVQTGSSSVSAYTERLCGLVVRVLGYRFGGPGSIPGTTRLSGGKKKRKTSSGSGTGSTQPCEYN